MVLIEPKQKPNSMTRAKWIAWHLSALALGFVIGWWAHP
jgi:hypothetical protein